MPTRLAFLSTCLMPMAVSASPVPAQAWPSRPITWVVPFGRGGVADIVSRTIAKALGERLGQSVVVDNRPGAAVGEAGWRGAKASSGSGIVARAGTPPAVVRRLADAVPEVLTDPEVVSRFLVTGEIPLVGLREQAFGAFIRQAHARWGEIERRAGLGPA